MYLKSLKMGMLGANCYIIADTQTNVGAVIDPGDYSPHLQQAINDSGIKELKYILCTHGHFDHASGVSRLKEQYPEAVIAVGAEDMESLSNPVSGLSKYFRVDFYPCRADMGLKNGDTLSIGNIELQVIGAPGHTPGGVMYYCSEESVMFTGDTVFKGSAGRTDLRGGDFSALSKTLQKLKNYPADTVLYSGHGESTTVDFELKYNPFLK